MRELINLMSVTETTTLAEVSSGANEDQWPGIDSMYRLIVVAALRNKQLLHGAHPRIEVDPRRRRNTSIALEEVKRGLVSFTVDGKQKLGANGNGHKAG